MARDAGANSPIFSSCSFQSGRIVTPSTLGPTDDRNCGISKSTCNRKGEKITKGRQETGEEQEEKQEWKRLKRDRRKGNEKEGNELFGTHNASP